MPCAVLQAFRRRPQWWLWQPRRLRCALAAARLVIALTTHRLLAQAALGVDSLLSATDLLAVLSDREALKSLIGAGLAANTMLPEDLKAQLANPAVQAVLTAAVNSADPAKFIMDALSSAGVDVSELLGGVSAPAPAPGPAHDLHEVRPFALQPPPPRKSAAAAVKATAACVAAAAAAVLLI